jgi:hypothetical protein
MLHSNRSRAIVTAVAAGVAAASLALATGGGSGSSSTAAAPGAQPSSGTGSPTFSNPRVINNRYLPLTAKRRCTFRGRTKDGTPERSVLTRLNRTRRFTVAGQRVDAAVFEDKAFEAGRHVETALDYYAQADDGTVYYLGEHVRNIRNGKVVNTEGTWLLGKHTNVPGVAMAANPHVGAQWHFEDVPGITTESNTVEETGLRTKALGRIFTDVIRVQEFIQPQGELEYKLYASGVGTIVSYDPETRSELVGCR